MEGNSSVTTQLEDSKRWNFQALSKKITRFQKCDMMYVGVISVMLVGCQVQATWLEAPRSREMVPSCVGKNGVTLLKMENENGRMGSVKNGMRMGS